MSEGLDLFGRPAVNDTGRRQELDAYYTPAWMTRSLLHHHPIEPGSLVLEPCSGDGSIARVLEAGGLTVITNDLNPDSVATRHRDATDPRFWELGTFSRVDYVITNPPFNVAFQILEQATILARVGVAFLLRKTFLEPTKERGPWLAMHPPSRIIGLPRHAFRGKATDSVSCDWMIWLTADRRRKAGPIVIDHEAKTR